MQITLNGDARNVSDGLTICDLLSEMGLGPSRKGIAVALDAEVVHRDEWATTRLAAGDRVDIIHVVQGG